MWDGEPVPYIDVRLCGIASIEFVGEAFRLPARRAGGKGVHGAEVIVFALTRSIRSIVRVGKTPQSADSDSSPAGEPLRMYLANGALPSGLGK